MFQVLGFINLKMIYLKMGKAMCSLKMFQLVFGSLWMEEDNLLLI